MAKTFATKALRDEQIVRDFSAGGVTKTALARIYGVDEKTVRRAIKEAGKLPVITVKVTTTPKSAKQAVKQMAKKAVGAKSSVKAPTVSAPAFVSLCESNISDGATVRLSDVGKANWKECPSNPHNLTGVIQKHDVDTNNTGDVYVTWSNGVYNAYGYTDLEIEVQVKTVPVKTTPAVVTQTPQSPWVGKRVQMSAKGRNAWVHGSSNDGFNPHNGMGTVSAVSSVDITYPVHVKWDNGQTNIYAYGHLDVIGSTEPAPAEQKAEPAPAGSAVIQALEAGKDVEFVITGDSVMLTLGDDVEIVESTHTNYKAIRAAILDGEFKKAYDLMNIAKSITTYTKGAITVKNGQLAYGEMTLKSSLVTRILELMAKGDEAFKSLVNFLERLLNNPSKDSVEQLWGFISHLDVEIDAQGYIIGWKNVNNVNGHLVDCHTGKVPNDVGNIVEMPRHMVNDDKDQTCSQGLHVAAWGYLRHFSGNTTLKVKVDPADVVSIPTDYNDMKMRAAKYEVVDTVDSNHQHVDFARAADVVKLHVKVGQKGQILESKPI